MDAELCGSSEACHGDNHVANFKIANRMSYFEVQRCPRTIKTRICRCCAAGLCVSWGACTVIRDKSTRCGRLWAPAPVVVLWALQNRSEGLRLPAFWKPACKFLGIQVWLPCFITNLPCIMSLTKNLRPGPLAWGDSTGAGLRCPHRAVVTGPSPVVATRPRGLCPGN